LLPVSPSIFPNDQGIIVVARGPICTISHKLGGTTPLHYPEGIA
jgi:hypothetical protein